jgi:hypothetical protein
MASSPAPHRLFDSEDAPRVFCATCGHWEFIHADNGSNRCLYSECECNRFVVGAVLETSARVLPP